MLGAKGHVHRVLITWGRRVSTFQPGLSGGGADAQRSSFPKTQYLAPAVDR